MPHPSSTGRRPRWTARIATLCALALSGALAGCEPFQQPNVDPTHQHILGRAGFGLDLWSRARIESIGLGAYLLEQLEPSSIPDPGMDARLAAYPSLDMDFAQLRAAYDGGNGRPPNWQIVRELQFAKLQRAIASRRQLQEVLVDFWFDHFNVHGEGPIRGYDITPYERDVIRPHVLGRFEDMLVAVARSPAMADYLDNRWNVVGDLNENFSRELLELHTLSLASNFSETDVLEVARCLTGWKIDHTRPDGFHFEWTEHDYEPKSVLGEFEITHSIGQKDGLDLLGFLASHPATADHIARKLVTHFVSDDPPQALVDDVARVYLKHDGDLFPVTARVLFSYEFLLAEEYRRNKVKRPFHVMVSAARALAVDPAALNLDQIVARLAAMGERPYRVPSPNGFPDRSRFWMNPGSIVQRFNAFDRAGRGLDGWSFAPLAAGGPAEPTIDTLTARLFADGVSPETRSNAIAFYESLPVDEQRRVEQATALLLSSPEFLLH